MNHIRCDVMETPIIWESVIVYAPKKYPDELRERAVRLVFELVVNAMPSMALVTNRSGRG